MTIRLKSEEEIAVMREGGRRHAEILRAITAMVAPGVSTQTLEDEARRLIEAGGDKSAFLGYKPVGAKRPFPAVLCVSVNEEIVHGIPNEPGRILVEGDIVTLDLGLVHKGLITDSAVTVGVGEVGEESRELLRMTRLALERGIEQARPGNTVGDIGHAVSLVAAETSFSIARDLAGHGVGFEVHEEPFIPNEGVPGTGEVLMPGMVIAIEPMLNIGKPNIKTGKDGWVILTKDGSRSAHFEHTVAITEKGHIVLTASRD